MPPLPARFAGVILTFAPLFVQRFRRHAQVLLVNFHRVLSCAAWCPRASARILLWLLIDAFAPRGPVVLALDDTIERRW